MPYPLPPFVRAEWDFTLFTLFGLLAPSLALAAFGSTAGSFVVAGLALLGGILIKVRLARLDAWNTGRPFAERIPAGSKWNQTLAMMLVALALLSVSVGWAR